MSDWHNSERLRKLRTKYIIALIIAAFCIFFSLKYLLFAILSLMFLAIAFGVFVFFTEEERQTILQEKKFEELTGKKVIEYSDTNTIEYQNFKERFSETHLFNNYPKIFGWGVGIAFAIVLTIIARSPIHDDSSFRKSSSSSKPAICNSEMGQFRREWNKRVGGTDKIRCP